MRHALIVIAAMLSLGAPPVLSHSGSPQGWPSTSAGWHRASQGWHTASHGWHTSPQGWHRASQGWHRALALSQQQGAPAQATPYAPKQTDRPEPLTGDEPGFQAIFDGKSLNGWEGNQTYWRAENGSLIGEIVPSTVIKSNTFIIWRGGTPADFELKLDYRITEGGNSGINYRSAVVPDPVTPENKFAMRGYQFDLDGRKRYDGNNYEEKGRLFLAVRGQISHVVGGRPPIVLSSFASSDDLAAVVTSDWNSAHLIVRGNSATHILNGRLMSVTIDDDAPNRKLDGLIGMQVHVGPPMKIECRNIRLKRW